MTNVPKIFALMTGFCDVLRLMTYVAPLICLIPYTASRAVGKPVLSGLSYRN